jgi:hypothetical protein
MASKAVNAGLPQGYQSPFKRVQMRERMDDSLACVATLTGRTLEDITKMAIEFGLPAYGPCFVGEEMIAKLLMSAGGLLATKYKEFVNIDALPDVAILLIDYDEDTEIGRHVIWHHVRGTKDGPPAHHYCIDPAHWIAPEDHYTSAVKQFDVWYYIEVTAKAPAKGK